jgi:hypothetical protein
MNVKATMDKDPAKDQLPLLVTRLPDYDNLNSRLRSSLTDMSKTVADKVSNQAGGLSYFDNKWLSSAQLHKDNNSDVQVLVKFIEAIANRGFRKPDPDLVLSISSMWGMVSKSGMTGNRHNHAGRASGAYYVDAGSSGDQNGGLMQFFAEPELGYPTHRLAPESGQLFMFPSSLEHSVSCYEGTSHRIVIAFNLD